MDFRDELIDFRFNPHRLNLKNIEKIERYISKNGKRDRDRDRDRDRERNTVTETEIKTERDRQIDNVYFIIYICYRNCRGLFFKKHEINYMLKYFKCDNSNEGQDSKMLYWLFFAPQTQTHKKTDTDICR